MITHLHKSPTRRDQELARIACALVEYAQTHAAFSDWLAVTLAGYLDSVDPLALDSASTQPMLGVPYVAPHDDHHAITLTNWLLQALRPHQQPLTVATLMSWTKQRSIPKDQVFGIVGIAIIGPTLGLIKKKKKKKSQLRIVIPQRTYETLSKAELVALTHTMSGRTVATELRRARGRVSALHPDTAEWLMSDHTTTLYTANPATFDTIHHTLTTCALPHTAHSVSECVTALGISPSLSDAFLADFSVTPVTAASPE